MASAAERYTSMTRARDNVLRQAREASRLTIPGLIPEEGSSDPHDVSEQPYSSLPARGVNNLSSKLLVSNFPPERPFFKLDIDSETADEMGSGLEETQAALAGITHRATTLVESSGSRPIWGDVFRHLEVAGNVLIYHPVDGTRMRMWRLDQYVVRRDAQGNLLEAVIREQIYPSELEDSVRAAVGLEPAEDEDDDGKTKKEEKKVELYTWILRTGDTLEHFEQINGIEVPGSRGKSKAVEAGWQALRWQSVPGSDYGRSFVSEYAGDLLTLQDAMKAILSFAAEASRILRIVDPNAGIDVEEMAAAETGDFLTGFADKISTLQLDKDQDFKVVWEVATMIERRLSQAFLLTTNTFRDAERVTAEEIRAIAQELEDAFGGTYTILSSEVQGPYARRLLYILNKQKKAPKLPASVTPVIITGFAALGRNHEVSAIREWVTDLKTMFGDRFVNRVLKGPELALRMGVGRGITAVEKLVNSPEEVAAADQQELEAEAASRAAPQIAKGAADAFNTQEA